jgi:outer membrane protein OmpA-like peptidoglycan-associated protein
MKTLLRWLAVLIVISLCLSPLFSQSIEPENKKLKSASLDGTGGLFKTWDAETLRRGEFNFSVGYDRHYRDPGDLRFSLIPVGGAIGVTNRLELFFSFDPYKRVDARNIIPYRVVPGALPVPAWSVARTAYFSQDAPFVDVPTATGAGNYQFGGKVNLFSERRKNPLAIALVGYAKLPYPGNTPTLNRGLGTGAWDLGWGALFSKVVGSAVELNANTLLNFVTNPEKNGVVLADLQHSFQYRGGAAFPAQRKVQGIAEIVGSAYFGSRTLGLNPKNPLDVIVGIRAYPKNWMSLGIGYQASLNHVDYYLVPAVLPARAIYGAETHGLVAQLAFGRRRNYPPTITCTVAQPSIKQDEQTTVRCSAHDPDGDPLTWQWSNSGGKISGTGDTVTFDATGVAPGKYTVTAKVSDGKHEASASADIQVIKKNLAPTVSCSPTSTSIMIGESTTVRATASDPNNDTLTYSWTINGEKVAAGNELTFGSSGRNPGAYNITVTVSDGEFTASCSSTVTIQAKPNQPPTISCVVCSLDLATGQTAQLQVRASDPDNDPLTITWTTSGGAVQGSGETATFDAANLHAGIFTVTITADDGHGGKASTNITVNVTERIPLSGFAQGRFRVDNAMKAALDEIAVRMNNEPRLRANIIGYTDDTRREKNVKALGLKRAQAIADYLKGKGIDPSRITVNDGAASNPVAENKTEAGRKQNRRVEIELVIR